MKKRALETEELWKAFCKNMDIPKRQGVSKLLGFK